MLLVETTNKYYNQQRCRYYITLEAVLIIINTKQTAIQYNKTNNTTTNKLLSTRNQGVCENYNKPINLIFILLFYFIEIAGITALACRVLHVIHEVM